MGTEATKFNISSQAANFNAVKKPLAQRANDIKNSVKEPESETFSSAEEASNISSLKGTESKTKTQESLVKLRLLNEYYSYSPDAMAYGIDFREEGEGYDFVAPNGKVYINLTKDEYDELVKDSKEQLKAMLALASSGSAQSKKNIAEATKFPGELDISEEDKQEIADAALTDLASRPLSELMPLASIPEVNAVILDRLAALNTANPNLDMETALFSTPAELENAAKISRELPPAPEKQLAATETDIKDTETAQNRFSSIRTNRDIAQLQAQSMFKELS